MEGANPTRDYRGIHPRQQARGVITLTGPTNNATLSLYNNSNAGSVLVVRAFVVNTTVAHLVLVARQQGTQGASGGTISCGVTGDGARAGQLYSLDTATAITPDWLVPVNFNAPSFGVDFPFEYLQPGWSLSFQDSTAAETMRLAILWEAVRIDQVDYLNW